MLQKMKFEKLLEKMTEFWDQVAVKEEAITPGGQESIAEAVVERLLEGVPEDVVKMATVLDVGCGEGRLAQELAKKVKHYVGIDISKVALARAAKKTEALDNVKFYHLTGRLKNVFAEEEFRIIVSWTVFMHMPKDIFRIYLEDIYAILCYGGYFHFQVNSNNDFLSKVLDTRFDKVSEADFWRARWYPEWLIGHYITQAGFEIEGVPEDVEGACARVCWRARK